MEDSYAALIKGTQTLEDLFTKGEHVWIQKAYAQDSKKTMNLNPVDEDASCFCFSGAIRNIGRSQSGRINGPLANQLFQITGAILTNFRKLTIESWDKAPFETKSLEGCIIEWNDKPNRTYADVCKLAKRVNAMARTMCHMEDDRLIITPPGVVYTFRRGP